MSEKILILSVDDSKAVHSFIDLCIKTHGQYDIIHAMSADEGLSLLAATTRPISLILLDWEMPVKSGPEFLVEIRKKGIETPVIMATSKNSPDDIALMINAGATEYIMKPFTEDILIEKIQTVLGLF